MGVYDMLSGARPDVKHIIHKAQSQLQRTRGASRTQKFQALKFSIHFRYGFESQSHVPSALLVAFPRGSRSRPKYFEFA